MWGPAPPLRPTHDPSTKEDNLMRGHPALLSVALAMSSLMAAPSFAEEADHYLRLTPANAAIGNFPSQKQPILTVKSGATVKIDGGGGNRWREQDAMQWIKENDITLTPAQADAVKETDRVIKE